MITGEEQIHPTTDSNYINNSDDHPTVGVWGGLTLKQHMVIEFTKAFIQTKHGNGNIDCVKAGIKTANEVIKQMNDEG